MLLDRGKDFLMGQAQPVLDGTVKLRRWTQSLADVQIADTAAELVKIELARGVGPVTVIGCRHEGDPCATRRMGIDMASATYSEKPTDYQRATATQKPTS